jgi:hypothetical protein
MLKQAFVYEKMMQFDKALDKYKEILNWKIEDQSFSREAEKKARDGLKRIKTLLRS